MRVKINHCIFDSDKATIINVIFMPDYSEALYRTQANKYFLHCSGNLKLPYKGSGEYVHEYCRQRVIMLTKTQANAWLQLFLDESLY